MKKSISLTSALCLGLAFATSAVAQEVSEKADSASATYDVAQADESQDKIIPCPFGWSVEPNPSLDNSLNYVTADGALAVSVTSLSKSAAFMQLQRPMLVLLQNRCNVKFQLILISLKKAGALYVQKMESRLSSTAMRMS